MSADSRGGPSVSGLLTRGANRRGRGAGSDRWSPGYPNECVGAPESGRQLAEWSRVMGCHVLCTLHVMQQYVMACHRMSLEVLQCYGGGCTGFPSPSGVRSDGGHWSVAPSDWTGQL